MMVDYYFYLKVNWLGNCNDVGMIESGNLIIFIFIFKEMDGLGEGINLDEMFFGVVVICYIIIFVVMMERSGLEKEDLQMELEGIVDVIKGVFIYKKIIYCFFVVFKYDVLLEDVVLVYKFCEKVELLCMILCVI